MANTSGRMLRLLNLLQTHRFWPGTELAQRLEVSERTLRRDIERLRDLGYPVDAHPGVAGGYQLQSGANMPPLLLDDDEAVAIAVGLRTSATGAVDGIEETSVRALAKIVQVMPPRLRRRVDALQAYTVPPAMGGGPTVDALALTVIASAARDSERLRFEYAARDGSRTTRLVEPHRLVPIGRRWYLVAWDVERGDWRTFRVDRLTSPEVTGARFRPRELPGDGDAAAYVRRAFTTIPRGYQVVLEIARPAGDIEREVARWGVVTPIDEQRTRLEMNVDDLGWPTFVLASLDAEFTVVGPPEFRDHLARVSRLLGTVAS